MRAWSILAALIAALALAGCSDIFSAIKGEEGRYRRERRARLTGSARPLRGQQVSPGERPSASSKASAASPARSRASRTSGSSTPTRSIRAAPSLSRPTTKRPSGRSGKAPPPRSSSPASPGSKVARQTAVRSPTRLVGKIDSHFSGHAPSRVARRSPGVSPSIGSAAPPARAAVPICPHCKAWIGAARVASHACRRGTHGRNTACCLLRQQQS